MQFLGPDRLAASASEKGFLVYDPRQGRAHVVASYPRWQFAISRDESVAVGVTDNPDDNHPVTELIRFGLDGRPPQILRSHGTHVNTVALDPSASLVATGSVDGTVRVGPVSGAEPTVLFGHEG